MNTELLLKIKDHILEEPARYSFDWVGSSAVAPCGTKACIAGWAMVLSGELSPTELREHKWKSTDAARVLDISDAERIRLFCYWPMKMGFDDHHDPKAAAARIDHFIATNGAD